MTLGALYAQIRKQFRDAGLPTPDMDAKLLLSHALGCAPDDVILKPDTPVPAQHAILDAAIKRRLSHEPVSKIIGLRGFYGLDFEVSVDVLDPRPDTETLVDAVRAHIEGRGPSDARILDLCTGSGCIALALLSIFPHATALGADISDAALAVAARNVARHGQDRRMTLVKSIWLENIEGQYDVMTCNPPYIPAGDIAALDVDVRLYDPMMALDGGDDGLNPYRILFPQIRNLLKTGGAAFFEIGIGQAEDAHKIADTCGLQVSDVKRDLGGIERVVCLRA